MDATVLALVRLAFSTIQRRILTICGLWMTFGLACWAMYDPNHDRIAVAAGFAVLVFIPSTLSERSHEKREQHEPE